MKKCREYLIKWGENERDIEYIMGKRAEVVIKNLEDGKKIPHAECIKKMVCVELYIDRIARSIFHKTGYARTCKGKEKGLFFEYIHF